MSKQWIWLSALFLFGCSSDEWMEMEREPNTGQMSVSAVEDDEKCSMPKSVNLSKKDGSILVSWSNDCTKKDHYHRYTVHLYGSVFESKSDVVSPVVMSSFHNGMGVAAVVMDQYGNTASGAFVSENNSWEPMREICEYRMCLVTGRYNYYPPDERCLIDLDVSLTNTGHGRNFRVEVYREVVPGLYMDICCEGYLEYPGGMFYLENVSPPAIGMNNYRIKVAPSDYCSRNIPILHYWKAEFSLSSYGILFEDLQFTEVKKLRGNNEIW